MATHSSILAWRIPWTEESGGLQSMGSQKARHYWVTNTFLSFNLLIHMSLLRDYKQLERKIHVLMHLPATFSDCKCPFHETNSKSSEFDVWMVLNSGSIRQHGISNFLQQIKIWVNRRFCGFFCFRKLSMKH